MPPQLHAQWERVLRCLIECLTQTALPQQDKKVRELLQSKKKQVEQSIEDIEDERPMAAESNRNVTRSG